MTMIKLINNINKYTNEVSTNGAAAKRNVFERLGKKVRPGIFGNIQVG